MAQVEGAILLVCRFGPWAMDKLCDLASGRQAVGYDVDGRSER